MHRLFFLLSVGIAIYPAWGAETLSLEGLLAKARTHNPDVIAAAASWRSAKAAARPAGTWPSPTFRWAEERRPTGIPGMEGVPMRILGAEQMIPFPGKLTYEMRLKQHDAAAAQARYHDALLTLTRDVRRTYYQLYLTEQSIGLAEQSAAILKSVLGTSQARLASNQTSASDVFMAQTELRRMENMLFEQRQERLKIQAELNALLNQAADTPLGNASAPILRDLPYSLAELQAMARQQSPLLAESHEEKHHGKTMRARERLAFAPDFTVTAERETMNAGPDGRLIGVAMTFPLWLQKPWGDLKAAAAHEAEAEAMGNSRARRVERGIYQSWVETTTHLTMTRNYTQGILPAPHSSLNVTRQQYASGRADFLRFLEAFRGWVNAHLEYEQQLYKVGESWSELERWVGSDLNEATQ